MRDVWVPLLCVLLASCKKAEEPKPDPADTDITTTSGVDRSYIPQFEDVTDASGLPIGESFGRLAVLDMDGDGHVDVMLNGIRQFRGNGDGTFTEVTDTVYPDGPPSDLGIYGGYAPPLTSLGGIWADVDNDLDLDFFFFKREDGVSYYWDPWTGTQAIDQIWRNDNGTFVYWPEALPDLTPTIGKPGTTTMGAAWADYDGDGRIDLAVATSWSNIFCCSKDNWTVIDPDATEDPQRLLQVEIGNADLLWHNTGDGFEDATLLLLQDWYSGDYPYVLDDDSIDAMFDLTMANGLAWADFDDDGDPDLYVANYRLKANLLLRNDNGSFVEVAGDWQVQGTQDWYGGFEYYGHSTGAAWGDMDNDGHLDLIVANLSHPDGAVAFQEFSDHTYLFKQRPEKFTNEFEAVGMEWRHRTGSPYWGDLDNDGLLDLFIGVGAIEGEEPYHYSDLYQNRGGTFEQIRKESGLKRRNDSSGIFADLNNDGLLDLVSGGFEGRDGLAVFLNRGDPDGTRNHWLQIRVMGDGSAVNGAGIGTRLTIEDPDLGTLIREVDAGSGRGDQGPLLQHFGVGGRTDPVTLTIRWPDGTIEIHEDLVVDQIHTIAR